MNGDYDNLIFRARSMAAHLTRWKWTGDAARADLLDELADALEDAQERLPTTGPRWRGAAPNGRSKAWLTSERS